MSAPDVLREAAAKARRIGTSQLGDDFNDPRHIAVADLLDESARSTEAWGTIGQPGSLNHCCFALALAYLGRDS